MSRVQREQVLLHKLRLDSIAILSKYSRYEVSVDILYLLPRHMIITRSGGTHSF